MAVGRIVFEPREDQVIAVRFEGGTSDGEFQAYLDELSRRLAEGRRFGFLFVAEADATASATQRRLQGEWLRANVEPLRALCWGAAFVLPNALTRLILTSVMALQRLPYPYTVVATREEGLAWLAKQRG